MVTVAQLEHLSRDLDHVHLSPLKDVLERIVKEAGEEQAHTEVAKVCADKNIEHPEWGVLGGRVQIHGLRQKVRHSFAATVERYPEIYDEGFRKFVLAHEKALDAMIHPERDLSFDAFGFSTLFKSYLLRKLVPHEAEPVYLETPQYMYLRVATFLWYPDLEQIERVYTRLSLGEYSHASPTAYNAGTRRSQLSSCFLMAVADSMDGLTKSWRDCAIISKNTGGLGCDYGSIRHSNIGYFGKSKGIISWLKIKQEILRSVDQGGRRKGSGTMYIPVWHVDVEEFLELRKNTGPEEMRARDLFQALWVSDLFMERVRADGDWMLFCPKQAPGLSDVWGSDFEQLYLRYEVEKPETCRVVKARDLWQKIVLAQKETGMPFMLYKDACNRKCNQRNLGTVRCSNLCVEIVEFSSPKEIASCNLAAVVLPKCVRAGEFDFVALQNLTKELVDNLNQTIDRNFYPEGIPEIPYANFKNRPIGIGVQGLADTFALLDMVWETDEARTLNRRIFEVMYYAALERSVELAVEHGPYDSFQGSPASEGLFQFDLWDQPADGSGFFSAEEWDALRGQMQKHGLRNSLLIALMPTASTAQILRNNEAFEPFSQMIYTRSVLSGTFVVINRHLVADLEALQLWTPDITRQILEGNGSVAAVRLPPAASSAVRERWKFLQKKYKTAYEISQKTLLDMALERGPFVDQIQSFNAWFGFDVTYQQITSFHFYGWEKGIKTGMYYLRQPARANPVNHGLLRAKKTEISSSTEDEEACSHCSA